MSEVEHYAPTWDQATERGFITWHCSEEDGGPDVGIELGLGGGRTLYAGELADATIAESGIDPEQGRGWWLAVHKRGGFEIIGSVADSLTAQEFLEELSAMLRTSEPTAAEGGDRAEAG